MADTAALAAIHRHVEAAGAKLLLVGDHRQLAAVGAGGGMDLLAHAGARYELAEARRFAHEWERDGVAAAARRRRDRAAATTTSTAGSSTPAPSSRPRRPPPGPGWPTPSPGSTSLLVVDTNEQAARLSAQLRAELVRLGRVDEDGVPLGLQGTYAGVGDLVQARRNGWDLAGYEGNRRGPINRETYRVTAVRDDGGLEVAPIAGRAADGDELGERMVLPGRYVAEHLALGYASHRARRPGPHRRHQPHRRHPARPAPTRSTSA